MKYICQICGYIYDEDKEKVPFSSLPSDWKCPLCGARKSDFKPEVQPAEKPKAKKEKKENHKLKELSPEMLSVIFSNLARGSEKQYKSKDAEDFRRLSDYYASISEAPEKTSLKELKKILDTDIENYPELRVTADENGDRGAARVCVWGEKVTRILSSLLAMYEEEGEKMLEGKNVWVCSVCGFVYVGRDAPELCPVCKVPSWKFEMVEA